MKKKTNINIFNYDLSTTGQLLQLPDLPLTGIIDTAQYDDQKIIKYEIFKLHSFSENSSCLSFFYSSVAYKWWLTFQNVSFFRTNNIWKTWFLLPTTFLKSEIVSAPLKKNTRSMTFRETLTMLWKTSTPMTVIHLWIIPKRIYTRIKLIKTKRRYVCNIHA